MRVFTDRGLGSGLGLNIQLLYGLWLMEQISDGRRIENSVFNQRAHLFGVRLENWRARQSISPSAQLHARANYQRPHSRSY
jgi:hypothetical protein